MLVERLRKEWHAHERVVPLYPTPSFTSKGLEMGRGTVVVPAGMDHCLKDVQGRARAIALLSTAYGRVVPTSALASIERAAKQWEQGQECLALIHLALAGLSQPEDRRDAARRLFMADSLIKAGIAPEVILQALAPGADSESFVRYMDTQPRVPAGNGITSGRWTKIGGVLLELTETAAKFLARMAAARLVTAAARNPYLLAAGLVLIPRTTNSLVEGDVVEIPGLRYAWNRDETTLRLTYSGPNGLRDINAQLGPDKLFRDGDKIVGRELDDGTLAIDPAEVSDDLADKDGPNLCPKPVPDKPGRGPEDGERDRDYEDQIKRLINPDNPTPRGYGYAFWDPIRDKWVVIDDCQHKTGNRFEMKGDYEWALDQVWGPGSIKTKWLDQSGRQLNASKGFELTWVFSQQSSADFAAKIFSEKPNDERNRINISVIPRLESGQ